MTRTWQVTICQTASGYLYHGEKRGDPSSAITLPAVSRTTGTFEATNRSYSYHVSPDELQVFHGSELLVEEGFILGE